MTTHASPHRRHLTGEINPDVVALLHHLPSLMLPPTVTSTPLTSSPGFPCEGFRQAAETYRLVLQGVSDGRYSTVADVLRGMTDVATATTTAIGDSGSVSAGSPRYCRWRDLSALEKAVSDASKTTQTATKTADAMYR